MAVEPLFVVDMDTLKERLRLTGAVQGDALAQIDQAVEDVRVGFFADEQGLGATRTNEILAIDYVENATTTNALIRTRANNLEVLWVRMLLMRRMPTLFMDGSGAVQQIWNEEGLTRNPLGTLKSELNRLEAELIEGLAYLRGDEDEEAGALTVSVFEPAVKPDIPGSSIRPPWLKVREAAE